MKYLFLLFFSFTVLAQKKSLDAETFLKLKSIGSFDVSVDGKWMVYTLSEKDMKKDKNQTSIHLLNVQTKESIPLSGEGWTGSSPKFSPDGKYISFLGSRGEKAKTQVWAFNRLGGDARVLTKVEQGVNDYEWSPDSKHLLLQITDKDSTAKEGQAKPWVVDRLQFKLDQDGYLDRFRRHYYLQAVGDSSLTQLTFGDFEDSQAEWSPNGQKIAFVSNRTAEPDANSNTDIWIIEPFSSDSLKGLRKITTNPNEDYSPSWSPNSKSICYVTVLDGNAMWYATNYLAKVEEDGTAYELFTKNVDRNVSKPKYSHRGQRISFLLENEGSEYIASVNMFGNDLQRHTEMQASIADFEHLGDNYFFKKSTTELPHELFYTAKGQLTETHKNVLDSVALGNTEKIRFKSKDGTEVDAFFVKPVNYEANNVYPTILWIHGGPVSQYDYSFNSTAQFFAGKGYLTILVNPRGSSGYGQNFSRAIWADWGGVDFEDVMAAVDYAIEKGWADSTKLGVGGWSYGGILTNNVITKTGRFKAAISGASCALYAANYGHDLYQQYWEREIGLPWENREGYEKISPFNYVTNISTPTLWIGGKEDWNVPIQNSEQMYQAMKRLGIETQLVVYPDEHHGIRRPSFQKDRLERYAAWFQKFLNP